MPHADSASLPSSFLSRPELWDHIYVQLGALLTGQRCWVSNLANASSLIYNTLLASPHFGSANRAVNWCGFYVDSTYFPSPRTTAISNSSSSLKPLQPSSRLLLGPFCGKPACQFIDTAPEQARGVCADAYNTRQAILVADVESYPGHIACDGDTKSEIVCPLLLESGTGTPGSVAIGVLDLDCLAPEGFNEDDKKGLERIAKLVSNSCDW